MGYTPNLDVLRRWQSRRARREWRLEKSGASFCRIRAAELTRAQIVAVVQTASCPSTPRVS